MNHREKTKNEAGEGLCPENKIEHEKNWTEVLEDKEVARELLEQKRSISSLIKP